MARVAAVTGKGSAVRLVTKNGRVEVALPKDVDADVSASTLHGNLTSELGSVPPPAMPGVPRVARMKLGNGGTAVELTTLNGDVIVSRAP